MQIQINYGACTVQYENTMVLTTLLRRVFEAIIKMSLKTDKFFFHFMKLIIILTFVKYISKHTLTTITMATLILIA